MSALAFAAKCRDQPTAFFLRRSSNPSGATAIAASAAAAVRRSAGTVWLMRASASMELPSRSNAAGTLEGARTRRLTAYMGTFGGVARTLEGTGPNADCL